MATDPEDFARLVPPDFVLGVSTAAFQVEGGAHARGRSVWDEFAAKPGVIVDGADGLVATDHFNRMEEDVALMRELGIDAYRFSLAWPRIQPTGTGAPDPDGIDFYDRLIDELLEAGIQPMATLFHWDTPIEIERTGGWLKRDTAERFADYARIAGEAFGDRVSHWVTINEPATVALTGYALDVHAPGHNDWFKAVKATQHLLLGHGLAVRALREVPVRGRIGISNVHSPVFPASSRWRDRKAAEIFELLNNRVFADPILLGQAPRGAGIVGAALRAIARPSKQDLEIMSEPLDFYGMHYYFPSKVAVGKAKPDSPTPKLDSESMDALPIRLEPWPEYETTGFDWPIIPDLLTVQLNRMHQRYGDRLPPIIFTEGGASFPDEPDAGGEVHDTERVEYLDSHLRAALRGVRGVKVEGYFVWTFLDNVEWAAGWTQRFGLVYVDRESLDRIPKDSFRWVQSIQRARRRRREAPRGN